MDMDKIEKDIKIINNMFKDIDNILNKPIYNEYYDIEWSIPKVEGYDISVFLNDIIELVNKELEHSRYDIFKFEDYINELYTLVCKIYDDYCLTYTQINNKEEIINYIVHRVCILYPPRSIGFKNSWSIFKYLNEDYKRIERQIDVLNKINEKCARQGTIEWHQERYNYISASSAWKIFESDRIREYYINERCKKMKTSIETGLKDYKNLNPMQKGVRYEPVSIQIYEYMTGSKIKEYGCIPHSSIYCLASSPDGINIKPNSERYGRMLEVKNVSTRKITGNPKKEYWIQMQLQMEVCDLNECDFLECNFKEYTCEVITMDTTYDTIVNTYTPYEQFLMDSPKDEPNSYKKTRDGKLKGMIIIICDNDMYYHKYVPLDISSKEEFDNWITKNNIEYVDIIYWYLEDFSCVLVPRNKKWFNSNKEIFEDVWKDILKRRENNGSKCLINMDFV